MFAACAIILLPLIWVSRSAPTGCEQLSHSLDESELHGLDGQWALVAGSLNHTPSMETLRLRDSITMYFSNSSAASALAYTQVNRFGDRCQHLRYNVSVHAGQFSFDVGGRFELTGKFLRTSCPDCLVVLWNVKTSRRQSTDLYLLSRRREVEPKAMDEFRAQLACYRLPAPVVMDPTKELCPEQSESQPTAAASAHAEEKAEGH